MFEDSLWNREKRATAKYEEGDYFDKKQGKTYRTMKDASLVVGLNSMG
ncbi:MAG: hypothetical protein QW756_03775 [Nitrososphaerota archaeon]